MKAHALQLRTSESRVQENRTQGLMREGRVKPALYSTRLIPRSHSLTIEKMLLELTKEAS
jgi:hypothetical protein